MAAAAATVCLGLVRDGASVTLSTPSGRVEAAPGRTRPLLEHLAAVEGGAASAAATEEADVRVVAADESVAVRFDGRVREFDGLVSEPAVADSGSDAADGDEKTNPEVREV
ncbi:hypothetical protein [Halobellus rufus]|uniref:hypothetical protein n=1 Tax=Halobellus rufus TaxID=1448860 RepID=UPI000679364A|nr:hypothetical protein [Halobellus rufus]